MYSYDYTFEDGIGLQANHKTETSPFQVGSEVEYEIKSNDEYGNKGSVKKPEQGNYVAQPTSNGSAQPKVNNNEYDQRQTEIVRQSSLNRAMEFITVTGFEAQDKEGQLKELCALAEIFTQWVQRPVEVKVKAPSVPVAHVTPAPVVQPTAPAPVARPVATSQPAPIPSPVDSDDPSSDLPF